MKIKIGIAFALGLGMTYLANSVWRYAVTPEGSRSIDKDLVQVLGGRAPKVEAANSGEDVRYDGKYMTFVYPSGAKILANKSLPRGVLEKMDLTTSDPRINLVVSASEVNEKYIDEIPGVRLRNNDKDNYSKKMILIGVDKSPVFTKSDGTEKVAFVLFGDKLFTMSMVGRNVEELEKMWNKILASFHFAN